ncbi:MAG TPA: nucleotidyl transferase AbiEii/AbiGii toxin family protein [Kofleriaceae bacterium]|nr:nucleotidyl transferase AbiEii/AbiGii toxin family protein [Kofleriaceae bacterium]
MRATFLARLENARIKMQVDLGLGDAVTPGIVAITYPVLLDLPAPELAGYPVETTIAEKLEAIVDLGLANSRMKDFFDLFSLLGSLTLDGAVVAKAITATFARRGTSIPDGAPIGLTKEFATDHEKLAQWSAFIRRLRIDSHPNLSSVVGRISDFALPIFGHITKQTSSAARWEPGSGWG